MDSRRSTNDKYMEPRNRVKGGGYFDVFAVPYPYTNSVDLGSFTGSLQDAWSKMQSVSAYGLSSTATLNVLANMLGVTGTTWEKKDSNGNVTERHDVNGMLIWMSQLLSPGEALAVSSYLMGVPYNAGDYSVGLIKLQPEHRAWIQSLMMEKAASIHQQASAWQQAQLDAWCAAQTGGCGASIDVAVKNAEEKAIAAGTMCGTFDLGCKANGLFKSIFPSMPNFGKFAMYGLGLLAVAGTGYYFISIAPAHNRFKAEAAKLKRMKFEAEQAEKAAVKEKVDEVRQSTTYQPDDGTYVSPHEASDAAPHDADDYSNQVLRGIELRRKARRVKRYTKKANRRG